MAHRALIEILGDASGFVKSLALSEKATRGFEADLKSLSVNAKASASAQIEASVKKTARLREEATAYRALAGTAKRGSAEQISAANLAARADARLAASLGVTAHESARLRSSSSSLERDLGRASRGALAGSGIFRGLGRSIAFASGGFLAFATGGQFIRTSIDAAKEAGVVNKQLGQQLKNDGESFATYRGQIDKTGLRISALSGFTKDDLDSALTTILRSTKNVGKALRDEGTAADLARAKHISLSQAALILGKVEAGNTTLLRRQGFQIAKTATSEEALAIVRAKVAGQAKAGTTEQERFGAVLHDSEVIIGAGLLPTLNKYLAEGATWLTQMNESGKLQRDVAKATADVKRAINDGASALSTAKGVIQDVDKVAGGFENTLKDLATAWLLLKARTSLIRWGVLEAGISGVGTRAVTATARVDALRASLRQLGAIGLITIEIDLIRKLIGDFKSKHDLGASTGRGGMSGRVVEQNGKFFLVSAANAGRGGPGGMRQITPAKAHALLGEPKPLPAGRVNRSAAFGADGSPAIVGGLSAGRRDTSLMGQFNLDELKLADAQRLDNTRLQRQILASEETIVMRLRDQAKKLKDRTAFAQQAASIEGQIRSIDQQAASKASEQVRKRKAAADKAKAEREKAELGGVPLRLQLAQAKADALAAGLNTDQLTKGQLDAAKAIRSAEFRAVKSHKLSMQGLIDAWNEIASINQELKGQSKMVSMYHAVSTHALTSGLDLTRDQRVALEERLAQRAAHRGTAPNGPAVLGQIVVNNPHFHGVQNVDQLADELRKKARSRHQRRGHRR